MELNDREIAGLFWTVLFFAVVLVKKDVRRVVGGVIQAFAQSVVLLALATATVWIIACVAALKQIGLWDWGNLKTTLIWGVTFAFVTMFDISRISEDRTYFGKTIRDIFGATGLITFVAELYSYSLPLELFLVPFLTFVAMLHVRAKTKPEYAVFGKLAGFILMVAWLGHFVYGLYRIATDLDQVASNETLREFAAPILLSLFFLPFMYGFSVYVTYQSNFARLNWLLEDRNLLRRAKLRTVLAFGFNLDLLRRWSRESALARPSSDLEVKKLSAP